MVIESRAFHIKDCALISLSSGIAVQTLREFREGLSTAPASSIYHHFWGRFLQPRFSEPEYNNDFAAWVYHGLHEKALAERLSVIDPTEFDDIEGLRAELIDRVEEHLDLTEWVPWSRADEQFHFIYSQVLVMDTGRCLEEPRQLVHAVKHMSLGSIFYHFIDARRRTPGRIDDFSAWLLSLGRDYEDLAGSVMAVDPYFSSLKEIRRVLCDRFSAFFQEAQGNAQAS